MKQILFISVLLFLPNISNGQAGCLCGHSSDPKSKNYGSCQCCSGAKRQTVTETPTKPSPPKKGSTNYYTGTDKSPVESMNDFNFLDKANPGSNQGRTSNDGFVNGGTLDFRTPAQRAAEEEKIRKQAENRATFRNLNNTISDLSNGLIQGQRNVLSNTQEKVHEANGQIRDQYRQADDTGILRSSHQNEVSTEELTLEDDIGEHVASYLVSDLGKDVSNAEEIARTWTGSEEDIGGLLGSVSGVYEGLKTTREILDGDVETIMETTERYGFALPENAKAVVEIKKRQSSFNEYTMENIIAPGFQEALDPNSQFDQAKYDLQGPELTREYIVGLLENIPIAGPIARRVGNKVEAFNALLNYGRETVDGIEEVANATGKLADAAKQRVKYEAKKWSFY